LPVVPILEIVNALPPFVSVKFAELDEPTFTEPKLLLVGLRLAVELPELVPVPVSDAFCGLFDALSAKVSVPVSVPVVAGLKVTVIVHELFAASVCGEIGQFDVGE
jgi:hypothetical protein